MTFPALHLTVNLAALIYAIACTAVIVWVFHLLTQTYTQKPDVRVHPKVLSLSETDSAFLRGRLAHPPEPTEALKHAFDREARQFAAFKRPTLSGPSAKGLDRSRLNNVVQLGDSRRAGR